MLPNYLCKINQTLSCWSKGLNFDLYYINFREIFESWTRIVSDSGFKQVMVRFEQKTSFTSAVGLIFSLCNMVLWWYLAYMLICSYLQIRTRPCVRRHASDLAWRPLIQSGNIRNTIMMIWLHLHFKQPRFLATIN